MNNDDDNEIYEDGMNLMDRTTTRANPKKKEKKRAI